MKNIILIAPPAAGKGTQAKLIHDKYKLPHISIGDLIRANLKEGNNQEIMEQMQNGKLISDEIVMPLLEERLRQDDCLNGYILDGFPRNLNQAYNYDKILSDLNKKLGYVILLEAPKDILKKRILGRVSCPNCGRVYNTLFENTKPHYDMLCDACNQKLVVREDDNEATFEKRYQTYITETKPIIKFYQDKGVLKKVNSGINQAYTFEQIEAIINEVNND